MNFSEKLKAKRKEFEMSQEQLAEKLGVSRQAITKWETDNGMPDIENIISIAALFNVTIDELLYSEKKLKVGAGFFHESSIEYDIDALKHYDFHIGGAYEVQVSGTESEKLRVRLASNVLENLETQFKVKIDDKKNNIDVDINKNSELSIAQAKDALYVFISLPQKYVSDVELNAHVNSLVLSNLHIGEVEVDGKVNKVFLDGVEGEVSLNSSNDMTVICDDLNGNISFNQMAATSILHIPAGIEYVVKKKRATNRVSHAVDGKEVEEPTFENATNVIKLSGLNMELVINQYTDRTKVD